MIDPIKYEDLALFLLLCSSFWGVSTLRSTQWLTGGSKHFFHDGKKKLAVVIPDHTCREQEGLPMAVPVKKK